MNFVIRLPVSTKIEWSPFGQFLTTNFKLNKKGCHARGVMSSSKCSCKKYLQTFNC